MWADSASPWEYLSDHWEQAAILLAGMLVGIAIMVMGRLLFRKRPDANPVAKESAPALDPFMYGSASEKRSSVRRTGKPIKVHISDAKLIAKPYQAWILDRSMGGLC